MAFTRRAVGTLFAIPLSFGNDDLLKVAQLGQVVGDTADLRLGRLLPGAVDGGGGERLTFHALTGHLRGTTSGLRRVCWAWPAKGRGGGLLLTSTG